MPAIRPSRHRTAASRIAREEHGVAVVEFALVLPLLLVVLLLIVDFGRVFNYWNDLNQVAAQGARLAAVNRNPGSGTLQAYLQDQLDTAELRDSASVCIQFPEGTSAIGDPVQVVVKTDFTLIPFLADRVDLSVINDITGSNTMRLEAAPTEYTADGGC